MKIQRTIPLIIPFDEDLINTVKEYTRAQNIVSPTCHNNGEKPLSRLKLHEATYYELRDKTDLPSQMVCSVMRSVSSAYANRELARRKQERKNQRKKNKLKKEQKEKPNNPIGFKKESALFLAGVGTGKDASFKSDGSLSIATIKDRKKLIYRIPEPFQKDFKTAVSVDSITLTLDKNRLRGYVTITLEVPEPNGVKPVGVDLNESNLVVAVNTKGGEFIFDGKPLKARNKRSRQVKKRLQSKLASRKAEGKDTRSIRRTLNRLGMHESNRTKNACRLAACRLVEWAREDAIIVLEDLHLEAKSKSDYRYKKSDRRRLNSFPYLRLRTAIEGKCEREGISVGYINPAYTSQKCNSCGSIGVRHRHKFDCPVCGYKAHSDVNAAKNIRDKFVVVRCDGALSIAPEARSCGQAVAL